MAVSPNLVSSIVRRRFEASPEAVIQTVLLFAVLKELVCLLLAIARGTVSLQDVQLQLKAIHSDGGNFPDDEGTDMPISPSSDSQDSESTCGASDQANGSSSLMSAVRILCRAIVQRDVKAVAR